MKQRGSPRHIAFVGFPGHGHVNPSLPLVSELARRGYRVTYAVAGRFAPAVRGAGALPRRLPDSGLRFSDDGSFLLELFRETATALPRLSAAYSTDRPDLVLYDCFAWAGKLLAARLGVPAARLCPIYACGPAFSLHGELLRSRSPGLAELRRQLEAFLSREGLPGLRLEDFSAAAEKFNIAFFPRWLQPERNAFGRNYIFSGPGPGPAGPSQEHRPSGGKPLALVSLGTVFNKRPDFFKACAEALAGAGWRVELSVGRGLGPGGLGALPPGVRARAFVRQKRLLERCGLFVSHGGMGGVMEALALGVPMVVAPQIYEQRLTAARLSELGLAAELGPGEVSRGAILRAARLATESPGMRVRLEKARLRLLASGGAAAAADRLEALFFNRRAR